MFINYIHFSFFFSLNNCEKEKWIVMEESFFVLVLQNGFLFFLGVVFWSKEHQERKTHTIHLTSFEVNCSCKVEKGFDNGTEHSFSSTDSVSWSANKATHITARLFSNIYTYLQIYNCKINDYFWVFSSLKQLSRW